MDNLSIFEKKLKELYDKGEILNNSKKEVIKIPIDRLDVLRKSTLKFSRIKALKLAKQNCQLNFKYLSFGKAVVKLREFSKLSIDSISELLNVKQSFLDNLENDRLDLYSQSKELLANILNIFNLSIEEFLFTIKKGSSPAQNVMARNMGSKRNKDVKNALNSALAEINKMKKEKGNYIKSLKEELLKLDRSDLV